MKICEDSVSKIKKVFLCIELRILQLICRI
jgi:hypothetical protein